MEAVEARLCYFFCKLFDETQMPKPQKYTDTFILIKKLFLVGLIVLQSMSKPVERPCSTTQNTLKYLKTYSADLPNRPKYFGYLK